jgi:hypothetical protein
MKGALVALLVLLSEFCAFGFLASYEPGDHTLIRVLYLCFGLGFLSLAVWMVLQQANSTARRVMYGLAGAAVGAIIALVLSSVLYIAGPRGDETSVIQGLRYGTLLVPIGAVIGARLGILRCR